MTAYKRSKYMKFYLYNLHYNVSFLALGKLLPGKLPLGCFLLDNSHPENSHLGKLPSRITPPGQFPPRMFPPRIITTQKIPTRIIPIQKIRSNIVFTQTIFNPVNSHSPCLPLRSLPRVISQLTTR